MSILLNYKIKLNLRSDTPQYFEGVMIKTIKQFLIFVYYISKPDTIKSYDNSISIIENDAEFYFSVSYSSILLIE